MTNGTYLNGRITRYGSAARSEDAVERQPHRGMYAPESAPGLLCLFLAS